MSKFDFTGKTAFITGGAQGIGRAIAEQFLRCGGSAVLADIDREAGLETAAELAVLGRVMFIRTDVSSEKMIVSALRKTVTFAGNIDLLVNNAAIGCNADPRKLSLKDWNRVMSINLTGTFLCAKHAAPLLKKSRGAIINIASTRAFMSEANTEAYSASKGGIVALSHALAVSLAPEVRVNCISPGWIDTSAWKKKSRRKQVLLSKADHLQHPAGRVGTPEDIASLVMFLASSESGFMTGANLMVDGGMTRKMIYV